MVAPTFWLGRKHPDLALRGFLFAIFSTSCLSVRRFALLATSDKSERETVRCCTQVTTRGCASSCVPTSTFPPLTFFLFSNPIRHKIPLPTSEKKENNKYKVRYVLCVEGFIWQDEKLLQGLACTKQLWLDPPVPTIKSWRRHHTLICSF